MFTLPISSPSSFFFEEKAVPKIPAIRIKNKIITTIFLSLFPSVTGSTATGAGVFIKDLRVFADGS